MAASMIQHTAGIMKYEREKLSLDYINIFNSTMDWERSLQDGKLRQRGSKKCKIFCSETGSRKTYELIGTLMQHDKTY